MFIFMLVMGEVPQHLAAGRAQGEEVGHRTLAAIFLCCSPWKDVLGKSEHHHWGYPETCPSPPADSKPLDEAWNVLSLTYSLCVIPSGDFSWHPSRTSCFPRLHRMTAPNSLFRGAYGCPASPVQGYKGQPCDLINPSVYPQEVSAHYHSLLCYFPSLPSPIPVGRPQNHSCFSFSWNLAQHQTAKVFLSSA